MTFTSREVGVCVYDIISIMAASGISQGYQCEFIDPVSEDLYCKQCSLVARKLTISSCCGESYCHDCIHSIQQANRPCPGCGQTEFETCPHVKFQKKVVSSQVFCLLKGKGCGWSGRLEELDAHLDIENGDCEFADIPCPLKCHQKITRKNIAHHVANKCVQRDYICPYCPFRATYQVISETHWPECGYYPLPCPNRCGVTCERSVMGLHINKICPLEEIDCSFKHTGCDAKFRREEEEQHMKVNSQTHLAMMATSMARMSQEFQRKFHEQEEKLQTQERKLEEQERKLQEQERKLQQQEAKMNEQLEGKLLEQREKMQENMQELNGKFAEQEKKLKEEVSKLSVRLNDFDSRIYQLSCRIGKQELKLPDKMQEHEERYHHVKRTMHYAY